VLTRRKIHCNRADGHQRAGLLERQRPAAYDPHLRVRRDCHTHVRMGIRPDTETITVHHRRLLDRNCRVHRPAGYSPSQVPWVDVWVFVPRSCGALLPLHMPRVVDCQLACAQLEACCGHGAAYFGGQHGRHHGQQHLPGEGEAQVHDWICGQSGHVRGSHRHDVCAAVGVCEGEPEEGGADPGARRGGDPGTVLGGGDADAGRQEPVLPIHAVIWREM
jgi:hypothetical protein